ncbi:hypothetical protein CDV36_013007 [Fusarium kuroshium]|uniref:Uncharacterized protein n=1 Tax=Fusarium kuroshium TaxID=2010991 RepID=A0A3M2RPY7_9HYPO|nr:hypothetical protein CDV36_013007 [Fusarium kuroshium]
MAETTTHLELPLDDGYYHPKTPKLGIRLPHWKVAAVAVWNSPSSAVQNLRIRPPTVATSSNRFQFLNSKPGFGSTALQLQMTPEDAASWELKDQGVLELG